MAIKFADGNDFSLGAVINIDKPLGWTSFDVVKKIKFNLRKNFGYKKIKVGHAGTLDPLATGVLVVCTGKMTKQIDTLMAQEKEYAGTIKFGVTTPSYDGETAEEGSYNTSQLNLEMLNALASEFEGELEQMPPIYSAKKVDGKRAYEHARGGTEVVLKTNKVRIDSFKIDSFDQSIASFTVRCGKGTYIRSLAHDLGLKAGSGAYLSSLRRTASGDFKAEEALQIDELITLIEKLALGAET